MEGLNKTLRVTPSALRTCHGLFLLLFSFAKFDEKRRTMELKIVKIYFLKITLNTNYFNP